MANNKETGHAKNLANFEREVLLTLEAKGSYTPFESLHSIINKIKGRRVSRY